LLIVQFLALAVLGTAWGAERSNVLNTIFPSAVEEALALSGAPEHLRSGASVYVYGPNGFEKLREGTNGFTCLLNRDSFIYGGSVFKPTCWDVIGKDSYVPVMLRVGELLAKGADANTVRSDITRGFDLGQFHSPTTGGIAYMLAGDIELDLKTGQIVRQAVPGHYMFYAVGVTSQQLGVAREASRSDPTLPFVFSGGAGGERGLSYIIAVPGDAHRHPHEESK
jgi:hypothetical protein